MVQSSKFTVQLLEKIGSPFTAAINCHAVDSVESETQSAQIMAQLLGVATQMSTTLYNALNIKEEEIQFDSTRLALAALAAPLIADFYRQHKQIPTEEDIKRIGQSLEAVVSFGENFSPATDHQSRLQTIEHEGVFFDKEQPILLVLQAMVPVINAVEEFSFGQSQKKLVQDITARLEARAADIAKEVGEPDKLRELIVFKALAALYASCHREGTKRASSGDEATRGELSIDPIWESFETKVAMIEAVMGVKTQSSTWVDAPQADGSQQEAAPQETPASGGGPMGFFKKPETAAEAPAETPVEPPVEAKETPPPPAAVPAQEAPAEEAGASSPPSSPMGFFKPEAQKKEDSDKS